MLHKMAAKTPLLKKRLHGKDDSEDELQKCKSIRPTSKLQECLLGKEAKAAKVKEAWVSLAYVKITISSLA